MGGCVGHRCDNDDDIDLKAMFQNPFHEQYKLGPLYGVGGFAMVYKAQPLERNAEDVAVKISGVAIDDDDGSYHEADCKLQAAIKREARFMQLAGKHENIVQIIDASLDGNFAYIVMELCDLTLFQALNKTPLLNETAYVPVIRQMLRALTAVHAAGVVHRDIKPDNFLCARGGTVKLCDFGMSEFLYDASGMLEGIYGTAPYMSPEMVSRDGYDERTDVWSLGATCYVLMFGRFPYRPLDSSTPLKQSSSMKIAICQGREKPQFESSSLSQGMQCFLRMLLIRDPECRPSADDMLQHYSISAHQCQASQLPCLRHNLHAAQRAGAFMSPKGSSRLVKSRETMDKVLQNLQAMHAHRATKTTCITEAGEEEHQSDCDANDEADVSTAPPTSNLPLSSFGSN